MPDFFQRVVFDEATGTWPPRPDAEAVVWVLGRAHQEPPGALPNDLWLMEPPTRREKIAKRRRRLVQRINWRRRHYVSRLMYGLGIWRDEWCDGCEDYHR